MERLKSRGIRDNAIFYLKKLNVIYGDGYFHNVQAVNSPISNELKHNILYDLLEKQNGKYYWVSAAIFQVVWNLVLIALLFCACMRKNNGEKGMIPVFIMGITLYLLIFEGRSKYLYMFLPVFLVGAGLGVLEYNLLPASSIGLQNGL